MKKVLLIVYLMTCYISIGQSCEIESDLIEIELLNSKGAFDKIFEKTTVLLKCKDISNSQKTALLIAQYKAQRNALKFKDAEVPLIEAMAIIKKNNSPTPFEIKFLLAENYAHLANIDAYQKLILHISDSILSKTPTNDLLLGRYYLASFRTTEKSIIINKAIDHLQNALIHFEKLSNPPIFYYNQTLWGLGNMYRDAGDFDKSLFYYKKGKEFLDQHYPKDHFDIGYYDYKIGAVYYEKMEYEAALDHFLIAREVWVHYLKPQDIYMHYLNEAIGDMYWELDDPENALTYFNYSILDEEKINNDQSSATITFADSLARNGNYGDALVFYRQAYLWRENQFGKNSVQTGACKNFVARALHFSGDTEGALTAYQEAISILVPEMTELSWYSNPTVEMKVQSHQYLLESLKSKGELLKELHTNSKDIKDLKAALDTQEVAILVIEDLKNNQLSESSREFWTARTLSIIESGIETAMQLFEITNENDYLNKAFNFSERSKAILLLASLYDQDISSFANVSEAIILKEKDLKIAINDNIAKIQNEENRCADLRGKMLHLWKNKLNSLQNEYDLLVARIQKDYPEYYRLKYDVDVVDVSTVQKDLLHEDTALISYFTGDTNTYVFLITSEEISVRLIPNTEELFEKVTNLFSGISSQDVVRVEPQETYLQFTQLGSELYNNLLGPEINNRNFTKLLIIPDGKLCYLPFEVLLTYPIESNTRDYKSLPYLLKKSAISYSPSASIQFLNQNANDLSDSYIGFAPDYDGQEYPNETALREGRQLKNLHYNSLEVEKASALFNGKGWTGNEVTEDLLKKTSSDVGILHFAMHGEVEDQHPLLSKLYFNSSDEEDGMLHVYEIYNMNISAQLVILSACNTASGKLIRGEGIVSLERAFQYAGSRSLLSTLWTVDDASSLQLTELFLQNIKSGNSKDVALRDAKLSFIETASPEVLHPFFWSSFKLTGNTEPFIERSNSIYNYAGLVIISLLLGVFYFVKRKKAKQSAA